MEGQLQPHGAGDISNASLIREQLARILASSEFAAAERLSDFLRFVVETCLAGQSGQLKETTIGVEVYRRDPGYDPRIEPIVRTEARRLRARLEEYYESAGGADPVRIDLPKGGYVPRFEFRPVSVPAVAPAVTVIPIAAPAVPRPHRTLRWRIAGIPALALVAAALYLALRPHNPPPLPVVRPLTSYPGYEFEPAISPDGKQFAFVYNGESNNYDIYVKLLDAGTPLRLTTDPAHDLHPAWSPDGRYVAFLRVSPERQQLMVVPALGGAEREIAEISSTQARWVPDASAMHPVGPAWSPDGKYLAIQNRANEDSPDSIYLIAVDTGARRKLTSPEPGSLGDSMAAFSPDGRRIAFVRTASPRGISDVFTMPVAGGPARQVTHDGKTVTGLAWWSKHRLLFVSNRAGGNMLWSISEDGGRADPIEMAGRNVRQAAASLDGSRVLYTERVQNSNVWRVDLATHSSAAERFLASTGRNDSQQYSPNGARIVFGSDRTGTYELWTANADGSNILQITNFGGLPVGSPRWSPDGRQIVFDAVRDGRSVIYRVDSNGGQPQLLVEDAGDAMMPTWSRDGQSIYYIARQEGNVRVLWKKPVSGGAAIEISRDATGDALESPDGHWIYYADEKNGIVRAAADGSGRSTSRIEQVRHTRYFAVTRRGIYFLRGSQPPCEIQLYDFATSRVTTVATMPRTPALGTPSLTVSPDDHWLLYSQLDEIGSDIMMLTFAK